MLEVEVGGSSSEACQVKCARPYLKMTKTTKMAGGMAQKV
jgi:hypothetical protein